MIERTSRRRMLLASAGLVGAAAGLRLFGRPAWADAPETKVAQADQTAVAVTIYNENLALVKDRRRVTLPAGIQNLAFVDVSGQLRPETALLHSDGGQLGVLEQNFEFDLLTPEKLLEESVGDMVKVVRINPVTGAEHRVRVVQPNGFEFFEAEIGRGFSKTTGPVRFELDDTYGQFAEIHLCQSGMVREPR